ncbi:MAG TPA: hypothetical protein DCR21_03950 [Succinivibrionaceae bacterium]|nr:hypothetical protein [Succinivibrionaceae bacterium]
MTFSNKVLLKGKITKMLKGHLSNINSDSFLLEIETFRGAEESSEDCCLIFVLIPQSLSKYIPSSCLAADKSVLVIGNLRNRVLKTGDGSIVTTYVLAERLLCIDADCCLKQIAI